VPGERAAVIRVSCPQCGKAYRLPPESAGKRGTCKACQTKFAIPADDRGDEWGHLDFSEEPSDTGEKLRSNELLQLLAESVEFPKQPMTAGHRLAAFFVACVMLVLPVLYLLFIAGVAWATWWHATRHYFWLGYSNGRPIPFAPILYGLPIVGGVLWIVSLLKPLLPTRGSGYEEPLVTRDEEPVLFEFAERLADKVGAPRPEFIRFNALVTASASYEISPLNRSGRKFTLTLGLPLLAGLTVSQLAGVMAHEFGHFTQRRGSLLLNLIFRVNRWFALAVYRKDAIDWMMNSLLKSGLFFLFLPGLGLWLLMALGRSVLSLMMRVGVFASASLMQRREFDADCYEAGLVGTAEFAETHRRLIKLDLAQNIAAGYIMNPRQCVALPSDLVAFIVELADRSPDVKSMATALIKHEKRKWWSTHPPTRERIQAAKQLNLPGAFQVPIPAPLLFETFEEKCGLVSKLVYMRIYRAAFAGKPICSPHAAADHLLEFVNSHRKRRKRG
jgi:Zn-dependent protease with chaperone function